MNDYLHADESLISRMASLITITRLVMENDKSVDRSCSGGLFDNRDKQEHSTVKHNETPLLIKSN
jgi:hypothetical protein